MIKIMLNILLPLFLLVATALNAEWNCEAQCQFYSTFATQGASNTVEVNIDGKAVLLSKRRGRVSSQKDTMNRAYEALLLNCFDLASTYSSEFINIDGYTPILLDKATLKAASQSSACFK